MMFSFACVKASSGSKVKILILHNQYKHVGGEDETVIDEASLLRKHGHKVVEFALHNDAIDTLSRVELGVATLWNRRSYGEIRKIIRSEQPEVVHAHNLFPLISPAAYYAAAAEGVPVVQSLHNYRLVCVGGMLSRQGRPCEDCSMHLLPWPGVWHACYRDRAHSMAIAAMLSLHRGLGTWRRKVDVFVTLTEFARSKFILNGFAEEKLVVKPNFVADDPGVGQGDGDYALYVGRLSPEKGVKTLLDAWRGIGRALELVVIGDGPLQPAPHEIPYGVSFRGRLPRADVYKLMRDAKVVIVPSEVYETFGRVIIEAFASGAPVIAADIGALAEVVADGRTGLLFDPGSGADLQRKVTSLLSDPARVATMRREARAEYERRYTAEANYRILMQIYEKARHVTQQAHAGPGRVYKSAGT
jgi:glycosyltransferase involved in cell wall biosynthesis